jgi:HEAT repeat protein
MTIEDLIPILLGDSDADGRRRAAEEIIAQSETVSGGTVYAVLDVFVNGLTDVDKGVRDICAIGLVQTFKPLARQKAESVAVLTTHADIEVRNLAADILLRIGHESAIALVPYLKDSKADNRKFACDIVGIVGHSDTVVIESVAALLGDEDANVRCAAIEALGYLKAEKYLPTIIDLFESDEEVRPYIIDAAGQIGGHTAQAFLLDLLENGEPFFQMTATDALAACADDSMIAHKLLERLQVEDISVQLLLLKAIYAIAFRLNTPIALPEEYRDTARQAMLDSDPEMRIAGLLALGPMYVEADIPALLHEVKRNTPDTQKHIIHILLGHSAPSTVGIFFDKLLDALNETCIQLVDIFGQVVSLWSNANPANAQTMIDTIVRQYPNIPSDYQKEAIELLMAISRERLVELLENELHSRSQHRVEDALGYIDLYSIRELFSIRARMLER